MLQTIGGLTAAGAAGIGVATSVAALRRRMSTDRTQRVSDKVESEFVELLLKERDKALADAREAWRVRQIDAEAIARLTSQNVYQQEEITRLMEEFATFKRRIGRLYPPSRRFLDSDYVSPADMADIQRDFAPTQPPAPDKRDFTLERRGAPK